MAHVGRTDGFLPLRRPPFRRRALLVFQGAAYWSGLGHAYTKIFPTAGAVILMYHSVADGSRAAFIDPRNRISPETFARHMAFLARRRNVVSMDRLADSCASGIPLPAGSVVLTFDDGYRDNLEVAAPILERHGLPALMYLPTGLVTRGESPWADELYTAFRTRRRQRLREPGSSGRERDLEDPAVCREVYARVADSLLTADPSRRRELLASIVEQLDPAQRPPRLTLSWDELAELRERHPRFALGVHSVDHVDLTAHGEELLRSEVSGCVQEMERELGSRPVHFAYPYNRRDAGADAVLRESGLRTAVTAGTDCLITPDSDLFRLPRIDVPRSMTLLRHWTSGAHPGLSLKLLGRA